MRKQRRARRRQRRREGMSLIDCPGVDDLLAANVIDRTTDPRDGWGNAFEIECEEDVVHVRSAGPDENMGTEDDIGF